MPNLARLAACAVRAVIVGTLMLNVPFLMLGWLMTSGDRLDDYTWGDMLPLAVLLASVTALLLVSLRGCRWTWLVAGSVAAFIPAELAIKAWLNW
jgi:hypothetical protein